MSRVDLDAPEHALCSEALGRRNAEIADLIAERDKLRARVAELESPMTPRPRSGAWVHGPHPVRVIAPDGKHGVIEERGDAQSYVRLDDGHGLHLWHRDLKPELREPFGGWRIVKTSCHCNREDEGHGWAVLYEDRMVRCLGCLREMNERNGE